MYKAKVNFEFLNNADYKASWEYQAEIQQSLVALKRQWQNLPKDQKPNQIHKLLFCIHPHVYTLGKSGSIEHLKMSEEELEANDITFFKINRGGDITYHGPGQITGYPIFDLDEFGTDVHLYVRNLEEAIIRTIAEYGLKGTRIKEYTGVWLVDEDNPNKPKRKICAIGVHLSRWVTMHGFAFNVNTDLAMFENIIPCGIVDEDKTVTSLALELGKSMDMDEVIGKLKYHLSEVFNFEYSN